MELSVQELKFIEGIFNGMSRTQSYIESHDTKSVNHNSLSVMAHKVWKRPHVQSEYRRLLEEQSANIKFPKEVVLLELIDYLQWLKENRSSSNASEIRRTLETINNIANSDGDIDDNDSGLKKMFMAIDNAIITGGL